MTIDRLKQLSIDLTFKGMGCIKYLPKESDEKFVVLMIRYWTRDNENMEMKIFIGSKNYWPREDFETLDEGSFINWVKESLTMMALHEVSELLMLNRKVVFNPHKIPGYFIEESKEDLLFNKKAA